MTDLIPLKNCYLRVEGKYIKINSVGKFMNALPLIISEDIPKGEAWLVGYNGEKFVVGYEKDS